mgnify:CR=1 FL=1
MYWNQGNYDEALKNYFECLEIQQRIKGKGAIDCASTLNNIGSVYDDQGNYDEALKNYFECLEIQQRIKGKESTDYLSTLQNIQIV